MWLIKNVWYVLHMKVVKKTQTETHKQKTQEKYIWGSIPESSIAVSKRETT